MVAAVVVATGVVAMVNVAVVAPTGTVTLAGTVAEAVLEVIVTAMPPIGAGLLMVKVPVELAPPFSDGGERESPDRVGWPTMRLQDLVDAK